MAGCFEGDAVHDEPVSGYTYLAGEPKPKEGIIRLVIERFEGYDHVSLDTQVSRVCGLMQHTLYAETGDVKSLVLFHKKAGNSFQMASSGKGYFTGVAVQDIKCEGTFEDMCHAANILSGHLTELNARMESCRVKGIQAVKKTMGRKVYNHLLGDLDKEYFPDLMERLKPWLQAEKPVVLKGAPFWGGGVKLVPMEVEGKEFAIQVEDAGHAFYVSIRSRYDLNPYYWLKRLYPRKKLTEIYAHTAFTVDGVYTPTKRSCDCGGMLMQSLSDPKAPPVCQKGVMAMGNGCESEQSA